MLFWFSPRRHCSLQVDTWLSWSRSGPHRWANDPMSANRFSSTNITDAALVPYLQSITSYGVFTSIFKLPLGKWCLWCLTPDCIQIHGPLWASCPSELLTRFWREAPSWPWRAECRTSRQTRQANRSPVTKTTLFTKWACNEMTKYVSADNCSYGTTARHKLFDQSVYCWWKLSFSRTLGSVAS